MFLPEVAEAITYCYDELNVARLAKLPSTVIDIAWQEIVELYVMALHDSASQDIFCPDASLIKRDRPRDTTELGLAFQNTLVEVVICSCCHVM
jgi:hypothetical protein